MGGGVWQPLSRQRKSAVAQLCAFNLHSAFVSILPLSASTATHRCCPKDSHKATPGPGSKQLQTIHTAFQMTPCCSHVVKADWSGLIHSKFTGEYLLRVIPSNPFQPTLMTVTENKSDLFHAGLLMLLSRPLELTAAISDLFQVKQ